MPNMYFRSVIFAYLISGSSLFTKRLDRWRHVGGGIPTQRSSVELIF